MNEFERGIDPKEAMGLGYAGLIKRFDELGRLYNFEKEDITKNPYFYHHNNLVHKWIQHWANSWNDLISLYQDEHGEIRVFFNSAAGDHAWDQPVENWLNPQIWHSNFNY